MRSLTGRIQLVMNRSKFNIHMVLGKIVARLICSMTMTDAKVYGEEKLADLPKPYIIVFNHCSHWDPVLTWAYFPDFLNFMVKAELHDVLSFGIMSEVAGNIPVHRETSDITAIKAAIKHLKKGYNLAVFAEGTRSLDGKVHPFKEGAFTLANRVQVPVVPVYLHGTFQVISKGQRIIRANPTELHVLDPVLDFTQQRLSKDEMHQVAQEINERMKAAQKECYARTGEAIGSEICS